MTVIARGRVLKGAISASSFDGPPLVDESPRGLARVKRVRVEVVEAHLTAERVRKAAEAEADALVAAARTNAQRIARDAADEARARELASLASRFLQLRAAEESVATRDLDKTMALAVVLAERLLGEALRMAPERVALLAKQALEEARGARVTKIRACPLDVEALQTNLASALPPGTVIVEGDDALARGSLVVETNLGTLDAQLTPQLERLAAALREHVQTSTG